MCATHVGHLVDHCLLLGAVLLGLCLDGGLAFDDLLLCNLYCTTSINVLQGQLALMKDSSQSRFALESLILIIQILSCKTVHHLDQESQTVIFVKFVE